MNQSALANSIIGALLVSAYFLLGHQIDKELLFSPAFIWASLLIYIFFMAREVRSNHHTLEVYPLKSAVRDGFLIFICISLAYYITQFLLYNYINPALSDIQKSWIESQKETIISRTSEEQYERIMAEDFKLTLSNALFAFVQSLIGGFVIAFVIAYIYKKE